MQGDLDFLKLSELAALFDFALDSNPLLLPPNLRNNFQETEHQDKLARRTSYTQDMIRKSHSKSQTKINRSSTSLFDMKTLTKNNNATTFPRIVSSMELKKYTVDTRYQRKSHTKLQSLLTPTITSLSPTLLERIKQADDMIFKEDLFLKYLENKKRKDKAAIKIQCQFRRYSARQYAKRLREEMMPRVVTKLNVFNRFVVQKEIIKKRESIESKGLTAEERQMFPAKLPPVSGRYTNNVYFMAGVDSGRDIPTRLS
ncbi:hypothetical protein AKO1_004677 [Acrasis kona]|uniref:Uncharacterized protein n=1 Tax=Acrasis kona TaxID=1008807 RepID=A0AAW2Z577_9EUKA